MKVARRCLSTGVSNSISPLQKVLSLEKLEKNLFRGKSYDPGWKRVFGGQVLGQALYAAQATVPENRGCHSLHSYFLRPGDVNHPIIYDVDRIRTGRSFSARRVKAIQNGNPIFFMTASFHEHVPDVDSFEHQDLQLSLDDVPPPESCIPVWDCFGDMIQHIPKRMANIFERTFGPDSPVEIRVVKKTNFMNPGQKEPRQDLWIRGNGTLPAGTSAATHRALLSFASDYGLLETALHPHAVSIWEPKQTVQAATIDHSLWFHHPFQFDEWFLHRIHAPIASKSRGLCFGEVIQNGVLVASTAQQGLTRKVQPQNNDILSE